MLQVAFATDDRAKVNQHFGASVGFAIYALDGERAKLVSVAEFAEESMDGNENKLPAKIAALSGCAAVYCLAVGGSAVRQLIAGGVQPIRLEEETSIERLLGELQKAVREGGVPWVEKALGRDKDDGRFARMAEEGWQE
ncbi:MAG: nitrogen fixation protein NifX [Gammaproteobacteria bacterium]|nr:nitrogen fixation protein NifX [Gammaproteobacteria bacterium]MBU1414130.1 nitrogen fixation protein NifX [Gammaproteobacteria bacterium]